MKPRREDPYEKIYITVPYTWIDVMDNLCVYGVTTRTTIVREAISEYLQKHFDLLVY